MVTFSDCMTLLLTFFVLLLSFSSFDNRIFRNLKAIYSEALTNISVMRRSDRDALMDMPPVRYIVELDKGSEKPTPDSGQEENLLKENELLKLRPGLAVLISSRELFWGQGTAFSTRGSRTMDLVGAFLKNVPSRVVISETGSGGDRGSVHFGLPRAWAAMEYLTAKAGLDRERFSISQASSLPSGSTGVGPARPTSERKVEIVLLERSIYN
jgi:chemotaxis protein MotB